MKINRSILNFVLAALVTTAATALAMETFQVWTDGRAYVDEDAAPAPLALSFEVQPGSSSEGLIMKVEVGPMQGSGSEYLRFVGLITDNKLPQATPLIPADDQWQPAGPAGLSIAIDAATLDTVQGTFAGFPFAAEAVEESTAD